MPSWEPDREGGEHAGTRLSADTERRTVDDTSRDSAASRHHEVSPREREDEARRDRREFGPFVCEHPFEDWIQDILDGRPEYSA